MAGKITGLVLDHFHPNGDPVLKLVFITLADRADERAICWPSRADLSQRSGASTATVGRKLRELERLGWIARAQRFQASTVFRINVVRLLSCAEVAQRFAAVPKGFEPFPEERKSAQVFENSKDDHGDRKDDHGDRKDDHPGGSTNPQEPKKELLRFAQKARALKGSDMTAFQRSCILADKSVMVGGRLVQSGTPEMVHLVATVRAGAFEKVAENRRSVL